MGFFYIIKVIYKKLSSIERYETVKQISPHFPAIGVTTINDSAYMLSKNVKAYRNIICARYICYFLYLINVIVLEFGNCQHYFFLPYFFWLLDFGLILPSNFFPQWDEPLPWSSHPLVKVKSPMFLLPPLQPNSPLQPSPHPPITFPASAW